MKRLGADPKHVTPPFEKRCFRFHLLTRSSSGRGKLVTRHEGSTMALRQRGFCVRSARHYSTSECT